MAETTESIQTVPQGMGWQLLEQGVPGDMFTGDVEILRVDDPEVPDSARVRITVDGDALTLTLRLDNALIIAQAITDAATDEEPSP